MMNRIFTAALLLVSFTISAHPVDSLITQVDSKTSVWVSPESMQQNYFLESTNDGKDWDTVRFTYVESENPYPFLLDFNLPSPIIKLDESNWVLPGFDGTYAYRGALLISKDRGRSWESVQLDKEIASLGMFEMHFSDAKNGVLLSTGELWNTDDGGYTWKKNSTIKRQREKYSRFQMLFYDDMYGVLKTRNQFWYTMDGGKTWSERMGEGNNPTSDVTLKHALISMRWELLMEGTSTIYIYDKSNNENVENYQLSFEQLDQGLTFNKLLFSRTVDFLSSEPTHVRIINESKEPVIELKNVSFDPGQIVVLSMDFENQKLEVDTVSSKKMNVMRQKLQSERSFELRIFDSF